MHTSLSSLKPIVGNINEHICFQQQLKPKCRQVVLGLVLTPNGRLILLYQPMRCEHIEGKANLLIPPQGGIKGGEPLFDALAREMGEEFRLPLDRGSMSYLGSSLRKLDPGHHRYGRYTHMEYHAVLARATRQNGLIPEKKTVATWAWKSVHGVSSWASALMTPEKGSLFQSAVAMIPAPRAAADVPAH